jgi:hypothetical protein
MATSEGFEPPTIRLEGECSIQLSYEVAHKIDLKHVRPFKSTICGL